MFPSCLHFRFEFECICESLSIALWYNTCTSSAGLWKACKKTSYYWNRQFHVLLWFQHHIYGVSWTPLSIFKLTKLFKSGRQVVTHAATLNELKPVALTSLIIKCFEKSCEKRRTGSPLIPSYFSRQINNQIWSWS